MHAAQLSRSYSQHENSEEEFGEELHTTILFLLRTGITGTAGRFGTGVTALNTRIATSLAFLAYIATSLIGVGFFG